MRMVPIARFNESAMAKSSVTSPVSILPEKNLEYTIEASRDPYFAHRH